MCASSTEFFFVLHACSGKKKKKKSPNPLLNYSVWKKSVFQLYFSPQKIFFLDRKKEKQKKK
jgi:hypothetical protein